MNAAALGALAMLGSAVLHAGMGLLTKQSQDRLVFRALMMMAGALLYSPVLILFPPPPWEAWRFLLIGAGLHFAFQMAMISAFERGNMNLVYPVMRGGAPALAGIAAFVFLGETLSPIQIAGLSLATAMIIGFAWPEKGQAPKAAAIAFALCAASMTALYSVNDASGVRAAHSPLVYVAWFFVVSSVPVTVVSLVRRGRRWAGLAKGELRMAGVAALFGAASYGLALYAFSLADVAPMAAMRETSVVFGAILAALVLKEPFGLKRTVLAILLAAGLVLLQIG
ncbi:MULTISPECIES: DMT family transporter [Hyphobacterium]|uniref:EamA family transporter n=1 Tax=Hyphobacterium vulgare TaxID=1736751 RepID=A0ABV6ZY08_9PROT